MDYGVSADYCIPDELWQEIQTVLPILPPQKGSSRPREDDRRMTTAIFYLLRTRCQWKALPRSLGPSTTVHDRFKEWVKARVFQALWRKGLVTYNTNKEGSK